MTTPRPTKKTILDRDPLLVRIARVTAATLTGRANPFDVYRTWRKKREILAKIKLIQPGQTLGGDDPKYKAYIAEQLTHLRSVKAMYPDVDWKHALAVPRIKDYLDRSGKPFATASVLCVGCRTGAELEAFEKAGAGQVTGIDLYSVDPERIRIMDMHKMTFEAGSFDVIFSADNLEHAYDVRVVLDQMLRVARDRAVFCIMTPVQFDPNARHPTDVGSIENLYRLVGPAFAGSIYEEMRASKKGQPYAVAIFAIDKTRQAPAAEAR